MNLINPGPDHLCPVTAAPISLNTRRRREVEEEAGFIRNPDSPPLALMDDISDLFFSAPPTEDDHLLSRRHDVNTDSSYSSPKILDRYFSSSSDDEADADYSRPSNNSFMEATSKFEMHEMLSAIERFVATYLPLVPPITEIGSLWRGAAE
ncbi:Probable CoA ligase CCL5 [Linum perenne]